MTGSLKVNTDELRNVGSAFTGAGDKLAAVQADAPLGDAAAAVPQLQTAGACNAAKASVATEMSNIATGARTYGSNLGSAAGQYESADSQSGETIRHVAMPSPSDQGGGSEPAAVPAALATQPASGPNLIYCYEVSGPDPYLCEGYNDNGPYTFPSPIDVSGVG